MFKLIFVAASLFGSLTAFQFSSFHRYAIINEVPATNWLTQGRLRNLLGRVATSDTITADRTNAEFILDRNQRPSTPHTLYSVAMKDARSNDTLIAAHVQQFDSRGRSLRTYLPTIISLQGMESSMDSFRVLFYDILCWYLDNGGRLSQLRVQASAPWSLFLTRYGFSVDKRQESNPQFFQADAKMFAQVLLQTVADKDSVALNIIGRIMHGDLNLPVQAINYYTKSLQAQLSSATFANLGSAYHATGELQLAFASYQQALQIQPDNALVYLKLAFFYDDFAKKDWVNASAHAEKCYRYYLQQVDSQDTAVLVRLGNLLVRDLQGAQACEVFDAAIKVDSKLENAWFNKAHAQLQIYDYKGAKESLEQTLIVNANNLAAKHMLAALDEQSATSISCADEDYVRELFDNYAMDYDDHGKKLLYAAPRIIRQELGKLYKVEYAKEGKPTEMPLTTPVAAMADACVHDGHDHSHGHGLGVDGSCSSYSSFVNQTLDILDLGCGTGQVGAWLKDYARSLVGVDLSPAMLEAAKRKGLYTSLHNGRLEAYLAEAYKSNLQYDVVAAADVFAYLGDVQDVMQQVCRSPFS